MHFVKFICTTSLHRRQFQVVSIWMYWTPVHLQTHMEHFWTNNFVELIKASRSILKQLNMLGIHGNALAKSDGAKHTGKYKTIS